MVLVDTSVWIDFFRNHSTHEEQILEDLIESESDIAICGVVRQEILQGISDEIMLRRITVLLESMYYMTCKEPEIYDKAASIYRLARHKGLTIRSSGDCLIAAIAIDSNLPILQSDRDFTKIQQITRLKLYSV